MTATITSTIATTAYVERAVAQIQAGGCVVLHDDLDAHSQGYLVLAAELATAATVGFVTRHSSGFLCLVLTDSDADRLDLPIIEQLNQGWTTARYGVSLDAREGVGTGISAFDRAHTIRLASRPDAVASDFTRPGHIVTMRAVVGGLINRTSDAEGANDLAILAGLRPLSALAALVSTTDPTRMADVDELHAFADGHQLPILALSDLVSFRVSVDRRITRGAQAKIPIGNAVFDAIGYRSHHDNQEHIVFTLGEFGQPGAGRDPVVRVQYECVLGDVFGSCRCDCRDRLDEAIDAVAQAGCGVVVYIREQVGVGGMLDKLTRYQGVAHNRSRQTPAPVDSRDVTVAAQILADLGIDSFHPSARSAHNPPRRTSRNPMRYRRRRLGAELPCRA